LTGTSHGLPSRDECLSLLREKGCDQNVVRHCEAVAELAVKIARKAGADRTLVEAGALLHDIGRCASHGMDHAVLGASLAAELKLPRKIVRIIERHIGAGLTKADAKALGLPEKDYIPETLEERIVAHADNLIDGSTRARVTDAVARLAREGKTEAARRVLELHRALSLACGMDIDDIR